MHAFCNFFLDSITVYGTSSQLEESFISKSEFSNVSELLSEDSESLLEDDGFCLPSSASKFFIFLSRSVFTFSSC